MAFQEKFDQEEIRKEVRKHYGRMAEDVGGASASSCCSPQADTTPMLYDIPEVGELPLEVRSLSAGCGDPVTLAALEPGQTVLDLGSGGGIDCFLAAQKVGPSGKVIGVDMTAEMVSKARANKARMGVENVEFRLGEIEHLPVADESVDVIISNCVINLSPDKSQVFQEAFRVLRPGGKLAVSDIVADGPLPAFLEGDISSWAGCVGGAMDHHEFAAELGRAGFVDVTITPQKLDEESLAEFLVKEDVGHSKDHGDGSKAMINLNGEWVSVDLGDRKLPFSARITACKPEV